MGFPRLFRSGWMAAAALLIAGCLTTPRRDSIRMVPTDLSFPLGAAHSASPLFAPTESVSLRAAVGETVTFAFAVSTTERSLAEPLIHVSPPISRSGALPSAAVRILRVHDVEPPPLPGWHIRNVPPKQRRPTIPDVLVPINAPYGGLPDEFVAGTAYRFLTEIRIPNGAFHDRYEGAVELRSRGATLAAIPVAIEVLPFSLPTAPWSAIVDIDHRALIEHHVGDEGGAIRLLVDEWTEHPRRDDIDMQVRLAVQSLARHGLTPVLPLLAPAARIEPTGRVNMDWTTYDRIAEPCLNGTWLANRRPLPHWAAPMAWLRHGEAVRTTEPRRHDHRLIDAYLDRVATHFVERGWIDRSYFDADLISEKHDPRTDAAYVAVDAAKRRQPNLRLLTRRIRADRPAPPSDRPVAWIGNGTDVLAPRAGQLAAMGDDSVPPGGDRRWVTLDRPPFSASLHVASPPSHLLALGWQIDAMGVEAALFGPANRWPGAASRPSPSECLALDPTNLLFPGVGFGLAEPVGSLRLKLVERSLQDAAYAELLRRKGLGHIADALRSGLVSYVGADARRNGPDDGRPIGWMENERAYHTARDIMIDAILEETQPPEPSRPRADFTRSSTWRRFMEETRRLHLSVDGCRVRGSAATGWELGCTASLFNASRVPVGGVLSFGELPPGWSPGSGAIPLDTIAPGGSRRATLTATTDQPTVTRDGATDVFLTFAPRDHEPVIARARVALAFAAETQSAPRVDGDLSDWDMAEGNTAADFRLIATADDNPGLNGMERARGSSPAHRTRAFARRTPDTLYFGLMSQTTNRPPETSRSNVVHWEEAIPLRDELVEILLDPTNAGTRDPGDLYRVSIKASGAYTTGRGFDAVEGAASPFLPWPADIRIAVRQQADRWTAEVAVPLAALGDPEPDDAVWGWNVTRFDAEHEEFSTWSGARGNAYDPLSLGNLFIPARGEYAPDVPRDFPARSP